MSQKVVIDAFAPTWAQQLVKSINAALDGQSWPFISKTGFKRANLNATLAAQYPYRFAIVLDGTSNRHLAQSDGSAFYYLDGNSV